MKKDFNEILLSYIILPLVVLSIILLFVIINISHNDVVEFKKNNEYGIVIDKIEQHMPVIHGKVIYFRQDRNIVIKSINDKDTCTFNVNYHIYNDYKIGDTIKISNIR